MANDPVDLTITRHQLPGQIEYVRIEARDHMKVRVQLDLSVSDFLAAIMGEQVVAALEIPPASMEHPIW